MNDRLAIERIKEIELDWQSVARSARIYGRLSTGLLVAAGSIGWISDKAAPSNLAWTLLCLGVLFGIQWSNFTAEALRAKLELSIELAKSDLVRQTLK
jgi:hypothetical protein